VSAALACLGGQARAGLVDEPFVGGVGFSGPTSGDPAAVYWNPAALGTTQDWSIQITGNVRRDRVSVDRAAIDPATGQPGGSLSFPRATSTQTTQPVAWPFGPGAFVGGFKDLGDRFTLAFALYRPFEEHIDYRVPSGDSPTRFHRLTSDLGNIAFTPAVTVRITEGLRVGLSLTSLLSTGHIVLDEPGPSGLEGDAASTRLDLASGGGLGDAHFSWLVGGGVYFRRRTWSAGLALATRPIGSGTDGIALSAGRSHVVRGDGSTVTCPDGSTPGCTYADITYRLPLVISAGAAVFPRPGLELATFGRILSYPSRDKLEIRVTSPEVGQGPMRALPDHVIVDRGAKWSLDARVRAAYWLRDGIRVGVGGRIETAAVPTDHVNPGAVDGTKLGPFFAAQVRIIRHIWIQAGYAFTYQLPVEVTHSAFDPTAEADCRAAGQDLGNAACQARLAGLARPTAAGTYRRMTQDFTAGLLVSF